ncbi:unnamed protein product [Ixodes persulcatus]
MVISRNAKRGPGNEMARMVDSCSIADMQVPNHMHIHCFPSTRVCAHTYPCAWEPTHTRAKDACICAINSSDLPRQNAFQCLEKFERAVISLLSPLRSRENGSITLWQPNR